MTTEQKSIPEWAWLDRDYDLEWVTGNLQTFWFFATSAYIKAGRGAIFVDTTTQLSGQGHPYGYFTQSFVESRDVEDIKRMVREYDPDREFVLVMLKPEDHISTYRVQSQPRQI